MYLTGFNGFRQLSNHTKKTKDPGSNVNFTAGSGAEQPSLLNLQLFHHLYNTTDLCFIWTNIFTVNDDGHLTARGLNAGFKGNELSHYLDQHKIRVRGLVAAGNNRVIVEDQEGSLWLYGEGQKELKALECSGSKDDLEINCATEKILVAVNGQKELYTADLNHDLKLTFTQPLVGLKATSVSCGLEHVVLVSDTGQVYSYGSGSRGQLGHGELTVDKVTKPTHVDMFEGIKIISVASGGWHSTAITADGDMYVWGWNESGQLGLPNGKETNVRKDHSFSEPVPGNSSEERRRKRQKTGMGTGDNYSNKESSDIPVTLIQHIEPLQVQTIPFALDLLDELKVKKVSCGTRHTCVVLESGVLMTCGWNNYGQLCHGDTESRDFLETVQYFIDINKLVIDVKAGCWNTVVQITEKRKT